jgi:hypothetical protein
VQCSKAQSQFAGTGADHHLLHCLLLLLFLLQNASRGDRVLRVGSSASITVGQWYRMLQKDPGDGSLMWELNGGDFPVVEAQKGYADPCRCA